MFEYPGSRMSDNLYNDVQDIKLWLMRFVPELEQQLDNLGADNFTSAYNERIEGLTTLSEAGKQKTTSDAIAEHLLDTKNPHKVTLGQLGYQPPQVTVEEDDGSLIVRLCGLMIQIKPITIASGTATAEGDVFVQSVAVGDWEREFGALWACWATVSDGPVWLGKHIDTSTTSAGTLTIYSATAAPGAGSATIIGIGRE